MLISCVSFFGLGGGVLLLLARMFSFSLLTSAPFVAGACGFRVVPFSAAFSAACFFFFPYLNCRSFPDLKTQD